MVAGREEAGAGIRGRVPPDAAPAEEVGIAAEETTACEGIETLKGTKTDDGVVEKGGGPVVVVAIGSASRC